MELLGDVGHVESCFGPFADYVSVDGRWRGVKTTVSMLFEWVSKYVVFGGSGQLRNTRITKRRCNGLSWFRPIRSLCPIADNPYTQEHPKSGGLLQSVKEEEFGRGLAQC
jgi:hypothetical protein